MSKLIAKLKHLIFPKGGGGANPLVPPPLKPGARAPTAPPSPTPLYEWVWNIFIMY